MARHTRLLSLAAAMALGAGAPALAQNLPFTVTEVADFDMPWALAFLPDGKMLVTEQRGQLLLYTPGGSSVAIRGVPADGRQTVAWSSSAASTSFPNAGRKSR